MIAAEAKVAESTVRVIKRQIKWKLTAHKTQCLDGREIDVRNIGTSSKFRNEKKEEQRRKAREKKEQLDGIDEDLGTNLDTLISRCDVCRTYFTRE